MRERLISAAVLVPVVVVVFLLGQPWLTLGLALLAGLAALEVARLLVGRGLPGRARHPGGGSTAGSAGHGLGGCAR